MSKQQKNLISQMDDLIELSLPTILSLPNGATLEKIVTHFLIGCGG